MLAEENPAVFEECAQWLFLSLATAVVTKARDTIEPEVMTQIVTKAKEMGKLTTWCIVLKKVVVFLKLFICLLSPWE